MQATRLTVREDRLRVMLIDDHPVVLAGLKSFLKDAPGIEVIATASNTQDAVGRAVHLRPDVFVVLLSHSAADPIDLVRVLKAKFADVAVLVMGLDPAHPDPKLLAQAGANAFLDGDAGRDALITTLDQLRAHADTGVRQVLVARDSVTPPPSSNRSSLSRRELQVLTLIADGNTNKQIADELGISVRTVETHRERLMRKLNVQGTAALTKAAILLGLVSAKS